MLQLSGDTSVLNGCELVRLAEDVLVRVFPGHFVACHSTTDLSQWASLWPQLVACGNIATEDCYYLL